VRLMHTIPEWSAALDDERRAGRTVGLVPTMGALHEGHATLIRRAAAECDAVGLTIFVNPLQFGPDEDLDRYPRTLDADCALAEAAGATHVLAPTVSEMYGADGTRTTVHVSDEMTQVLEGASRPIHFDGVTTVVAKLFAMTGRGRAYFGEKDWQQLAVVARMARDLSFPIEIVPCATTRDHDGVALSSRNAFLSADERAAAPVLHRALQAGAAAVANGERNPAKVRALMEGLIAGEPLFELDYAVAVDAATLQVPDPLVGDLRMLVAARLRSGSARLIDNLGVTVPVHSGQLGTHRKDD
jgi:pantoate--beta-alanine ligase